MWWYGGWQVAGGSRNREVQAVAGKITPRRTGRMYVRCHNHENRVKEASSGGVVMV